MIKDGKGYLTPDPPDVPDVICIKVFIPKHRLYIAAFWGAYQFFTNWNAWARDPLRKGREAARVWKRAYEMARAHWDIFQGDCGDMINNLRTKPLNPCILQALNDDGVWVDVFDAGCCGGSSSGCGDQLRVNGDTIERYDPSCDCWVPAGPATPPQETPVTPPPYPPSSDGACIAATNFGALIEQKKNLFATVIGDGLFLGEAILQGYDLLISLFGYGAVLGFLGEGVTALYSAMAAAYADVAAYDIEDQAVCLAVLHYANDGTMSQSQVDALLDDIQKVIDSFDPEDIEATAWRYVWSWVNAAGPAGMATAANFLGITEGACADCPWEYIVDFTQGAQGFTVGPFNLDPAFYNAGYLVAGGWTTQLKDHSGGPVPELDIKRLIPETTITNIDVEYLAVVGDEPNTDGRRIVVQGVEVLDNWATGPGLVSTEFDPPIGVTDLHVQAEARDSGNPLPTASCIIKKVHYKGTGQNPFVAPLPPIAP